MTDKIKFDIIKLILIVIELYFREMMLLTKVLLPIAMIIIPAFLILALIKSGKNPTSADDEEQLYRQMLQNPTDAAVKRYIRALDGYCRRTERPALPPATACGSCRDIFIYVNVRRCRPLCVKN